MDTFGLPQCPKIVHMLHMYKQVECEKLCKCYICATLKKIQKSAYVIHINPVLSTMYIYNIYKNKVYKKSANISKLYKLYWPILMEMVQLCRAKLTHLANEQGGGQNFDEGGSGGRSPPENLGIFGHNFWKNQPEKF